MCLVTSSVAGVPRDLFSCRCAPWPVQLQVCPVTCSVAGVPRNQLSCRCASWPVQLQVCPVTCSVAGVPHDLFSCRCTPWPAQLQVCPVTCSVAGVHRHLVDAGLTLHEAAPVKLAGAPLPDHALRAAVSAVTAQQVAAVDTAGALRQPTVQSM